ncbi:hypothetical protein FACS1894177_02900 [Bacteroidia bacterium]|nr:hypothetical protein FACS1894177_02900 [Bacteroidia bacterium]
MGFLTNNCILHKMDEQILKYCHPFVCVDEGVNDFFQREFIEYENNLFANSYCFLLKKNPKIIVAAFAISSDSITRLMVFDLITVKKL